jgi:seryl-tRNA synthetase
MLARNGSDDTKWEAASASRETKGFIQQGAFDRVHFPQVQALSQ